jgi:hypothetical protein
MKPHNAEQGDLKRLKNTVLVQKEHRIADCLVAGKPTPESNKFFDISGPILQFTSSHRCLLSQIFSATSGLLHLGQLRPSTYPMIQSI